jgi:hypothetical protein
MGSMDWLLSLSSSSGGFAARLSLCAIGLAFLVPYSVLALAAPRINRLRPDPHN